MLHCSNESLHFNRMKLNRTKVKTLRVDEEVDAFIKRASDITTLKETDIITLLLKAAVRAVKPHSNDEIRFPLALELTEFGNKLATRKNAPEKARKIKGKDMGPEGFEPTTNRL